MQSPNVSVGPRGLTENNQGHLEKLVALDTGGFRGGGNPAMTPQKPRMGANISFGLPKTPNETPARRLVNRKRMKRKEILALL